MIDFKSSSIVFTTSTTSITTTNERALQINYLFKKWKKMAALMCLMCILCILCVCEFYVCVCLVCIWVCMYMCMCTKISIICRFPRTQYNITIEPSLNKPKQNKKIFSLELNLFWFEMRERKGNFFCFLLEMIPGVSKKTNWVWLMVATPTIRSLVVCAFGLTADTWTQTFLFCYSFHSKNIIEIFQSILLNDW
jgi:hypothetical protein